MDMLKQIISQHENLDKGSEKSGSKKTIDYQEENEPITKSARFDYECEKCGLVLASASDKLLRMHKIMVH